MGKADSKNSDKSPSRGNLQFDPVGHCIYCGTPEGKLGREHVMPFGMHGEMVLPQASCDACSIITGKIENFVLGRMLVRLRIRYGLKSRKKKRNQRPETFEVTVNNPFTKFKKTKTVTNDYLPWIAYSLPAYELPGLLRQVSPEESGKSRKMDFVLSKFDAENMLALGIGPESVGFQGTPFRSDYFSRFLAKVAHSFLVATLGEENFEPILIPLILDGHEYPTFWVGCEDKEPAEANLFEISHGEYEITHGPFCGTKYIAVKIRLFSFLGTPTYIVAAGERRCDEDWFFNQPGYALPAKVSIKDADGNPVLSIGV